MNITTELSSVDINSGVNEQGEGFCTVIARSSDDSRVLMGQLDPDEVRQMALVWLSVAEAADQDAAVLRATRKLELPDNFAGAVIAELRNSRQ